MPRGNNPGMPTKDTDQNSVMMRALPPAILSVALFWTGVCRAEESFTRIANRAEDDSHFADPTLGIAEASGARLFVEADTIYRLAPGSADRQLLVKQEETGAISDLAVDPAGFVLVAAEQGVFVIGPNHDTVERYSNNKNFPRGVRSLQVGSHRRLWFITTETFGCIHLETGALSLFSSSDGLPPPPYRRLRKQADGSLILYRDDDAFSYRPDVGPGPMISIFSVNDERYRSDRPYRLPHGQKIDVGLTGAGRGTIQFRVIPHERKRHSTGKVSQDSVNIDYFDPGLIPVRIVAFDRDLRQSKAAILPVDVALPVYYSPKVVLPIGIGGLILVGLLMWFVAWRAGGGVVRYQKAAVSGLLIVLFGMQLLSAIVPHARGWPFVGWGMYTEVRQEGSISGYSALEGLRADGSIVPIDGWHFHCYPSQVIKPLIHESEQAGPAFVEAYNSELPDEQIVGIRVVAYQYRLDRDGAVPLIPRIRTDYRQPNNGNASGSN